MSESTSSSNPLVGVVMGSKSDWDTMQHVKEVLEQFHVPHECRIVSAHRTPSGWPITLPRPRDGDSKSSSPVPAARHICPV